MFQSISESLSESLFKPEEPPDLNRLSGKFILNVNSIIMEIIAATDNGSRVCYKI